jgi:hypothetical protein
MPSTDYRIEKSGHVMDQPIHFLDANHQAIHGVAPSPSENAGLSSAASERTYRPGEAHRAALESSVFTFITGVLMSGSLVAAVGTLIKALASFPG